MPSAISRYTVVDYSSPTRILSRSLCMKSFCEPMSIPLYDRDRQLASWIETAVEFVEVLPEK
jgi:hypothetical protein